MQVRIYQPAKSTMQSGHNRGKHWMIEPALETRREPEPVMGWTAAGDTYGELSGKLKFSTAEDAMVFAKQNGWSYTVVQPKIRKNPISNYLDNFKHKPQAASASTPPGGKA